MQNYIKNWRQELYHKWWIWLFIIGAFLYEDEIRSYVRGYINDTSTLIMQMLSAILENSIWIPWVLVPVTIISLLMYTYFQAKKETISNTQNETLVDNNESTDQNIKEFTLTNRPYLNAKLIPFKESDSFYRFKFEEKGYSLELIFEVTNKGGLPAKNITVTGPERLEASHSNKYYEIPLHQNIVSLGINDKYFYTWSTFIPYEDTGEQEIKKNIEEKLFESEITMKWSYTSDIDDDLVYETIVSYLVQLDNAQILKKDFR